MADQLDQILKYYYDGVLKLNIKLREIDLKTPTHTDDNVGGGKASHKHSQEAKVIANIHRVDTDEQLNNLKMTLEAVETVVSNLPGDKQRLLLWHYKDACKHTWEQLESLLSKSKRQLQRDLLQVKGQLAKVLPDNVIIIEYTSADNKNLVQL